MGFTTKAKSSGEGWGTGFLLVFFPENCFHSSSPSSSSSPSLASNLFKSRISRTNSNHILSRAQSTISICVFFFFFTLLLFTLSTFEPTTTTHFNSRRRLSSNPPLLYQPRKLTRSRPWSINIFSFISRSKSEIAPPPPPHALQGMGTLYRRGTKAMNDVVVGHVTESVTEPELRLFLRLLHRSGLTSRSDLVLLFPSFSHSSAFETVIREENDSFSKLIHRSNATNSTFDATLFVKSSKKEKEWGEPIWGRRIRSNYSGAGGVESTRLSYGSVVSFVADELDPENSLAGFLDQIPMSLRRWPCYPMLLGRIRRNFKHVMLIDVKEVLLLGDPLGRLRNRSPESVHLSVADPAAGKHGKKHAARAEKAVTPAVVMGGARGVRRLSKVMLTEIVRSATATQRRKSPVVESALFNQLVGNDFVLNNVNVVTTAESFPDASSLTRVNPKPAQPKPALVRRGNSNTDVVTSVTKMICSLEVGSSVYSDC